MKYNRVSAAAAVAALCVSALVSGASSAGATAGDGQTVMACYDTPIRFSKPSPHRTYPWTETRLRTSSNCNDINIKLDTGSMVQVCFYNAGGYCSQLKWAASGKWAAIATNVRDNAEYYFVFQSGLSKSGYIAD
ncbi:hypothetical protein ACWY4P_37605 [Streptomyces sp. LZ34]